MKIFSAESFRIGTILKILRNENPELADNLMDKYLESEESTKEIDALLKVIFEKEST